MTQTTYTEMSKTAEGRHELHTLMLAEVRAKIDSMIINAPVANQAKVKALMDAAYTKIAQMGNGNIFTYFAEDGISTKNFVSYIQDVLKGAIQ